MITTASREHLGGIVALWQQAFGNSAEYINLFWEQCAKPANTLVYLQGGTVCGMLFILPCSLVFGNNNYQCAYFYGVATRQEARGRGISTQLLEYAYSLCGKRGYDLCALVPATPSLFGFYAKRGFTTQGYIKTLSVGGADLQAVHSPVVFSTIDHCEAFAMRKDFFGTAYLEWDTRTLEYIQTENRYTGGSFHRYDIGGSSGYLCCVPHNDTLLVTEFVGSEPMLPDLLRGLHEIYNKHTYLIRLSNTATAGKLTPFAMTKWITAATYKPFYQSYMCD